MCRGIKKFIIAFLAVICFTCLAFAVACQNETVRFTLVYVADDCVTVISEAQTGAQVKKDAEVSFSLEIADGAEGTPVVSINGVEIKPDANGVYKFKMAADTTVQVSGVYYANVYNVEFDRSYTVTDEENNEYTYINDFITYLDEDGNVLETKEVSSGERISFKLYVSVYYGNNPEYTVTAGTTVLNADANGVYSFTVTGNTKVNVKGLTTDISANSFANRADGGEGTQAKPFLIREAADLYTMADLIENEFYADGFWQTAYYRLEKDIDMNGEQLYVIGNTLTQLSMFAGVFDGNGHTIKNYKISNSITEQSGFIGVNLPFVGLFGFTTMATIVNLNLEDFIVEVDGAQSADNIYAGAIAGYARGTTIQNCSASGTIIMNGSEATSFVGGLAGAVESFSGEDVSYPASVQSCHSDVEVSVRTGAIFSAGGITGYLYTEEERVSAFILNCYTTGDVYGAMRAGGIAGEISPYSSIKNCYATGNIEADNDIAEMTGNEAISFAYAGGIAGYAEHDSIISDSFFTGTTDAYATETKYEVKGSIVGGVDEDGTEHVYSNATVVNNCWTTENTDLIISDDLIKTTMGWSAADWKFTGNGMPQINKADSDKTYTVTIIIDDEIVHEWTIENYYASMGHWYAYHSATLDQHTPGGIPEFIGDGNRTYGYFFDEECTKKVPFGYVPTDDIVLYAAYADYNSVAGIYYLQGKDGYIELTSDGYLYYRNGALNVLSTYVYNGDYLVLNNTFLAILASEDNDFYTFKAELNGGTMSIYDAAVYTQNDPLIANKQYEGFRYGTYYDAQNNEYTFNPDGTGAEKFANGTTTSFTFTLSYDGTDFDISVKYGGASRACTVENGLVTSFNGISLTVYDVFRGTWESSAGVNRQYYFDGAGNWTYKYYDYDADGKEVEISAESGTYIVNGGELTLDGKNFRVEVYGKFLLIDGETFYKENSFKGLWSFAGRAGSRNEPIEIDFNGIGTDGYGTAVVSYLKGGDIEVNYTSSEHGGTVTVVLYYYYTEWGRLTYDKAAQTLTGSFYSNLQSQMINNVIFCLHDELMGEWNGTGAISSLKFNGLGKYDIPASNFCLETKGFVFVNGNKVSYTLDAGALTGSFSYDGKTYTFEYDRDNGTITVTCEEESCTLNRKN